MAKEQFKLQDPALEPYSILKDKYAGYVIEESVIRVGKDGSKSTAVKVVRYPTTIESAIRWIAEAKLADKGSVLSLKDFLKEYNTLKSQLSELLNT